MRPLHKRDRSRCQVLKLLLSEFVVGVRLNQISRRGLAVTSQRVWDIPMPGCRAGKRGPRGTWGDTQGFLHETPQAYRILGDTFHLTRDRPEMSLQLLRRESFVDALCFSASYIRTRVNTSSWRGSCALIHKEWHVQWKL